MCYNANRFHKFYEIINTMIICRFLKDIFKKKKTLKLLRVIDPIELKEATKGIQYRYFQFSYSIFFLPFTFNKLHQVYKNALVESCLLNLRCLLEFFNKDRKSREISKGITGSVFVEHYFNPLKDTEQYQIIEKVWNDKFIGTNPRRPIMFKCKDDYTKKYMKYTIYEIIELINSHLPHQGVWNIEPSQKAKGRISYKISN